MVKNSDGAVIPMQVIAHAHTLVPSEQFAQMSISRLDRKSEALKY
jgi:hypothetical protein